MDGPAYDAQRFKDDPDINNYSGLGSTLENTKEVREALTNILNRFNVTSIIDAPCGDCSWIKHVDLKQVTYYGYDILDLVLKQARTNIPYGTFEKVDLAEASYPNVDLIICRDFLFHIDFQKSLEIVNRFRESGSGLLLTSSFDVNEHVDLIQDGSYIDCLDYGFRPINLRLPPFDFSEPILAFDELEGTRYMGLWKINA